MLYSCKDLNVRIFLCFSKCNLNFYSIDYNSEAATNTLETSSEILDDILKQLDKLSPEKRKKVLDRLTAANVIGADLKSQTKQTAASTTETHRTKPTEASQDEVEILDLHNPKMGIYKKKRSKLALLF